MAGRGADPCRRLAERLLRRHADRRCRTRRSVPRGARREPRACADPDGPLDQHLRRLQRLGRTVAVHRRLAGVDAPPDGVGVPDEARAAPAQDAAPARPRGPVVLRVGRTARRVCVERRRGMVELERPFAHWAERNDYRFDVAISTDLETVPGLLEATARSSASATTNTGPGVCARRWTRIRRRAGTRRSSAATPVTGRFGSITTPTPWSASSTAATRTPCSRPTMPGS